MGGTPRQKVALQSCLDQEFGNTPVDPSRHTPDEGGALPLGKDVNRFPFLSVDNARQE
jgi:hypothetical protein